MDVFAHTLWTNALFHLKYSQQRRMRYLAAFFGVAPDFVGFAPLFLYLIVSGKLFGIREYPFDGSNWTFGFAEQAYNYTHSLVIFLSVLAFVLILGNLYKYFKNKQNPTRPIYKFWFFWPMLGWALHIIIDFPTHPDFYHTPILFPLSDFRYTGGVAWSHPTFMVINYSLLIAVYVGIYIYQKKNYGSKAR